MSTGNRRESWKIAFPQVSPTHSRVLSPLYSRRSAQVYENRQLMFPKFADAHALQVLTGAAVAYKLMVDAQDRLARYAASALKAGIEERRVRLAESQGAQLAGVVQAVLAGMLAAVVETLQRLGVAEVDLVAVSGGAVSMPTGRCPPCTSGVPYRSPWPLGHSRPAAIA